MIFESDFDKAALISRFDDLTSEARFAGADEQNDWVFQSTRKGDKIKIVRKPKNAYDPFATVFRGKITETKSGSAIKGVYTKSLPDYIFSFFVFFIYYAVCFKYYSSSADKTVPLTLIFAGALIILLLFSSLPHTRKRYGDFIRRVTEGDGESAAKKPDGPEKDPEEKENSENKEKEEKNKFKFRF